MTKAEVIRELKIQFVGEYDRQREAKDRAIKFIEQLQKIQEIIKSWKDGTIEEKDSIYAFHKIREVLEDGDE